MSEITPVTPESNTAKPEAAFTWSVHPARERPVRTVLVSGVILLAGRFVQLESGLLIAGFGAMLVLVLVLQRFFFPSRYRIDAAGLSEFGVWGQRTILWSAVRLAEIGGHGAWISELERRHWREGRRGVHVLFGSQREKITAHLRAHLPETVTPPADSSEKE